MSVTIRANARVLDLEIGQVVEGLEWTPLLEGAAGYGFISVVPAAAAEPEATEAEPDVAAPAPTVVEPESEPEGDADE